MSGELIPVQQSEISSSQTDDSKAEGSNLIKNFLDKWYTNIEKVNQLSVLNLIWNK